MSRIQNQPNSKVPNPKKSKGSLNPKKQRDSPVNYLGRDALSIKNSVPEKPRNTPETDKHIDNSTKT